MSGFGANPTTTTQPALPTNQFPLSSVAVPGAASGNLTALEGGPASTDSNGNPTAPASMYVKDGSNVTQGVTTDAAVTTDIAATISAKLRGLVKISGDIWDSTNHRIRVDGSGVTQPISAASLPLPSGAATSAKQPALGIAGTASSDVITVQGIASMTALKTDGSGVTQPVSGTVSVSNFPGTQPVSGTVTANAGTNLNTSALALESGGNLAILAGAVTAAKVQTNIAQVSGATISNTNPVPSQDIEQPGYIAATSPPSTTNAGGDTAYTFSSQVNRVIIQNNTSANINCAFDVAASAGSWVLVPGAMLIYPKKVTVLHLFTAAAQNINGTSAGNIVVLGAL